TDTPAELDAVRKACEARGVEVSISDVWANGGAGAEDLAKKVVAMTQEASELTFAYDLDISIQEKLDLIVQKVYGGTKAALTASARREARQLSALGFDTLPICMAKTQYSFSDNPKLLGAPEDFEVTIRSLKVS